MAKLRVDCEIGGKMVEGLELVKENEHTVWGESAAEIASGRGKEG